MGTLVINMQVNADGPPRAIMKKRFRNAVLAGIAKLAIIISANAAVKGQEPEPLPFTAQEIQIARATREPFRVSMQSRMYHERCPDFGLANSILEDTQVAIVTVVKATPEPFTKLLTLRVDELVSGPLPALFTSEDDGGPSSDANTKLPNRAGWSRVAGEEGKRYFVFVRRITSSAKYTHFGEYLTLGVLDLQTDEAQWLPAVRRLMALKHRSSKEGIQVFLEGLKDETQLVRTRSLWQLAKHCKVDAPCWNAAVNVETDFLQNGNGEAREEAINALENLTVRSVGIHLTDEYRVEDQVVRLDVYELSPPDFSIEKDAGAIGMAFENLTLRSDGLRHLHESLGARKVRSLMESELADPDLAIGDEAYSLLTILESGAPEYRGKCSFIVPAMRKKFVYTGIVPLMWPILVRPLIHWSLCSR